jgi:hypothetical protein
MCTMIVTAAMPVVRAKARAIATNIFVMEIPRAPEQSLSKRHHVEHPDVVLKGDYLLRTC